jgi:hypothetical protein
MEPATEHREPQAGPTCLELLHNLCGDEKDERKLIRHDLDAFRSVDREELRAGVLFALRYAIVKYGIGQSAGGLMSKIYAVGRIAGMM